MRAEWSYRTDSKGHREPVGWHKKLKDGDNFKGDSEGRRGPRARMNAESKGNLLARAATKGIIMPAINDNKWPPGSFLVINFYEKAKMAAKFAAGHLRNGDSTEKNGNAKESGYG